MANSSESSEISDDEFICRRIPIAPGHYDAQAGVLDRKAFNPNKNDSIGLSVSRIKSLEYPGFLSIEELAVGPSKHGYYMAILNIGDLRKAGITVVAAPVLDNPDIPDNAGHAELPQLTYDNRKTSEALNLMGILAERLTLRIEGPFTPSA